ncbi:monooxygenase (plasmid) [Sphingobium sp. SCG-1]|uniref:MmoB/DmpM family protein n=1 Tax=Sphingobium sp. SCG-1 TaxID=2072936 RepID=UPI000CD6AE0D|nr:MmoB/DmpM family protein [Sphingobium sp. SCG-1]AUW60552.1 monooxygenase [Sphingobium sp. SCG-1]
MAGNVSITLQNTDEGRAIIEAISSDNEAATVNVYPSMTKIDCPNRLVVRRESIEINMGRAFDLQELQLSLVSLAGNVDEDDDEFVLAWNR